MTSIVFLTEAISCNIFRCNYLRNEKYFLYFQNSDWILNTFKKRMTLIVDVFFNLRTPKYVVRKMSEKFRFRRPFDKYHGKRAKTLSKSERQDIYHIYLSLWRQLSWKKSPLAICKLFGQFVYTLTANDKYSLLNRDNLLQDRQRQLS